DFFPFIPKVKRLGYDILEVHSGILAEWTEAKRQDLAKAAKDEGIQLSYGLGCSAEYDVSSPNEKVRQNGLRYMTSLIQAVGRMGGGVIQGSTYCAWPKKLEIGESKQRYVDQSFKSMNQLAKVAEDCNVIVNMEILNRFEQFVFNTVAEALPFVSAIDSPNLGLLLDTFHMNIEEDSLAQAILLAGKYMKGLHCGETNRKPVGMGRIPWKEIRDALDVIHFDGQIIQEPFVSSGGQVGQDISVWREVIENPDLDKLASDSAAFMRKVLVN
ncbi:D-psicose 3-epimerase, partial [Sphaerochaeta sp.]|uniref:D-psicose 3-epimerase n=1 Tax=Sphaerochaeta sp. TaxID=1972642 RepID=UPI002FC7394A